MLAFRVKKNVVPLLFFHFRKNTFHSPLCIGGVMALFLGPKGGAKGDTLCRNTKGISTLTEHENDQKRAFFAKKDCF